MIRSLATAAILASAIAAPASAVTLVAGFTDTGANIASVTLSNISLGVTVSARRYFVTPGLLNNFAQTSAPTATQLLTRSAAGLGINGGASNSQMDTNRPGTAQNPLREAFLITGTNSFRLTGLRLTNVDADDTLRIFGINNDGSFVALGFGSGTSSTMVPGGAAAGTIRGGAGGSLLNLVNTAANNGTSTFDFVNDTRFSRYLITSRVGGDVNYLGTGGQGFALARLTGAVPEPATWGLLIIGFGMVGVAARRRSNIVAA